VKTLRALLLERHAGTGPKLDAVRQAALGTIQTGQRRQPVVLMFFQTCWEELIRPCRLAWTGMVAIWLVLIVFNLSRSRPATVAVVETPALPAEVRVVFQEQQRLLDELVGQRPPLIPAEPSPRPDTRPRSERRKSSFLA
jgi:hypothetical protein